MTTATATEAALRLRDMTADDLDAAHALSRLVQWPHRREDWAFFLDVGLGVIAERDGVVLGTAMAWPYGEAAASLGLVIVSPEAQGGGIGRKLMQALIERLGSAAILLNATEEGLKLYRSLGFEPIGAIRQHQGAAFSVPIAALSPHERIRPLGASDKAALLALDLQATGLQRETLITALLGAAKGVVLDREGEAIGFALMRRFGRGYLVGPVIAPDLQGAKALISHWLGTNAGMFTRLDVQEDSGLVDWLEELGIVGVGRVTTMVRGAPPARDDAVRAFAIAGQAVG